MRKKALILIVEGETDEAVFEPMLKKFLSPDLVRVQVTYGDVFTKKENYKKSPKTIVGEIVSTFKKRYGYKPTDIIGIIQITDIDGSYLSENNFKIDADSPEFVKNKSIHFYDMESKNIICQSEVKRSDLLKTWSLKHKRMEQLKSITKIAEFPYRLYYMHFDLDCVIGGKPCYTSAEKRICTNNFCQMINGDLTKFIKLVDCKMKLDT